MKYPKLRYPIATMGISKEDRLILLSYDMIWRLKDRISKFANITDATDDEDIDANLSNLGHHIETLLCAGDMTLRFEGYDNVPSGDMQQQFMDKVQRELFTEDAVDESLDSNK